MENISTSRKNSALQEDLIAALLELCTPQKKDLLTVWPGKVPQLLAFSLFLLLVMLFLRCCLFLVLLLSNYSRAWVSLYGETSLYCLDLVITALSRAFKKGSVCNVCSYDLGYKAVKDFHQGCSWPYTQVEGEGRGERGPAFVWWGEYA